MTDPCNYASYWEIPTRPGGVMHTGPYFYVPRATHAGLDIETMEDFDHRKANGRVIFFLRTLRTDFTHWLYDMDWTIESGGASIDVSIPYNYDGGSSPIWTSYGGEPGDPAEVEIGTAWFIDNSGARCEVNLTAPERERVEIWIYENPPDYHYGDD